MIFIYRNRKGEHKLLCDVCYNRMTVVERMKWRRLGEIAYSNCEVCGKKSRTVHG